MQNKKDKITTGYVQILRGDIEVADAVFLSLALITWLKLSRLPGKLLNDMILTPDQVKMPRDAESKLKNIGNFLASEGFTEASRLWGRISQRSATEALEKLFLDEQRGLLVDYDPSDLIFQDTMSRHEGGISPELADLLIEIASPFSEDTVYLPWEQHGQLLGRVLQRGGNAAVECLGSERYVDLIRTFYNAENSTMIQISNPIHHPTYSKGARLTKFDTTIACPPMGVRVSEDVSRADAFDRFPETTTSHNVLVIRHVLAQTNGRAVIAVPNGLLSSAGAEKSLRKDLLEMGVLEAVVALPPNQMMSTSISISILVLNTRNRHAETRMVNCATDEFAEPSGRGVQRLLRTQEIAALALGHMPAKQLRIVKREEIYCNDFSFAPGRYVIDDARSKLDDILGAYQKISLESVTKIIRTLPVSSPSNPVPALEIGAIDLTESGYLLHPTKKVNVQRLDERDDAQFLQPSDIVLVFKGSVGKVGICPPDTPPPGPNGWVVGQSMVILRCDLLNNLNTFSPMGLVMLLRSAIGKYLISRVTAGATQPFLSMNELKKLQVPLPSKKQSNEIETLFQKQVEIQLQIQSLQRQLNGIQFAPWSVSMQ